MKTLLKLGGAIILSTITMNIIKAFAGNLVKSFLLEFFGYSGTMTQEIAYKVSMIYGLIYAIIYGICVWLFLSLLTFIGSKIDERRNDDMIAGDKVLTQKNHSSIQKKTTRPAPDLALKVGITSQNQQMNDLEYRAYEQVGQELETNNVDRAIWTKAFTLADGDDKQTRVLYIKDRVQKLLSKADQIHADDNSQGEMDLENRTPCVDKSCIGVIGPDGHCKECGKPFESKKELQETGPPIHKSSGSYDDDIRECPRCGTENRLQKISVGFIQKCNKCGNVDYFKEKGMDEDPWRNRMLCSDGNCIGVIGRDGRCKMCGKKGEVELSKSKSVHNTYGFENNKKQLQQKPFKGNAKENLDTVNVSVKYKICSKCKTTYSHKQLTCDNCGCTYLKPMGIELSNQDAQEFISNLKNGSHKNLQQSQVSKKTAETNAIWNPNAASNWSIIFTPAFGSYLHALNWRTLGKPDRAQSAMVWFYFSLGMLFVYISMGFFMADEKAATGLEGGLGLLYLIIWYFSAGRSQAKYVKVNFGSDYPCRSWSRPLLIGVAAIVGYFMLTAALGFIVGSMSVR